MSRLLASRRTAGVDGKGIEVGSVVCYSRNWLRSTGQFTGTAPFAKGTVTALEPMGASQLAVIDWGKDRGELPSKVLSSNLILNSNRHLELASKKKATTIVSKQTLEQAIQEGHAVAEQLLASSPNDKRLDQIEAAVSFLEGILVKSPTDMQQEGASTLDDYLDDAVMPEMAQKIKQDVDMIANMKSATPQQPSAAPVLAAGSDNWVNDRDENGEPKKPELAQVPRLATEKKAAPAVAPAAPAPAPVKKPNADITQLSSDTLAKMQKALAGSEDLMNDKAAQAFIAAIAEELMNRPVETEAPEPVAPAAPAAMPVAASLVFGLNFAADEDGNSKVATSQGGAWFVTDKDTGTIKEDGGRTPEIGEAHGMVEDNTGIKRPATELPSKFATEMTSGKAVKTVEKLGDQLKALYLEAKPITQVLDSRPVREAVESIFRAYDMMGEAAKLLSKQHMQEEAEAKATEVKEKNKKSSLLMGLSIAGEE